MPKITDIYREYKIMPNLQEHMLRVAAVASVICDNWQGELIDKKSIVTACLLHDIGNIIKFRFNLSEDEQNPDIEYWRGVRNEFIEKYGTDEHHATIDIVKELGQSEKVISYIDGVGHDKFGQQIERDDMGIKIVNYADTRVSPYGIVSYQERMDDVLSRYRSHPQFIGDEVHNDFVTSGYVVEEQIFKQVSIKPEYINDLATSEIIEELKNFEI